MSPLAEVLRDLHGEVRRSFPALERDITGGRRVYLNNAGGTLVAESSVRASFAHYDALETVRLFLDALAGIVRP